MWRQRRFPMFKKIYLGMLLSLPVIAGHVLAKESGVLTEVKQAVLIACDEYQKGIDVTVNNRCKAYIDGFIDASLIARSAAVGDTTKGSVSSRSELVQRATKYRIGAKDTKGNDVNYDVCIPQQEKLLDVKAKVINHLDLTTVENRALKYEVLSTLKRLYPC